MKIDIITLHRVRNYGSSLQTLATQNYIKNMGCEVEVIDYYPERYSTAGLLKRLKYKDKRLEKNPLLLFTARIIILFSYLKKKIVFDKFLKKYINLTKKTYKTEQDLLEDCPKADAYCTGSDQVWNSHWNEGVDRPFYLSFIPDDKYRFSYAASIGNEILSEEETNAVYPLLRKYQHITVRENSGVNVIDRLGLSAEQMLDPTLLFSAEEWGKYIDKHNLSYKYVLTYNLHHDKRIDKFAKEIANSHNLKVVNISYNLHDIVRGGKLKWCPKIERYLKLIHDAEYVVTDSFHATVFSILFRRKFLVIYPEQASSRIRSILSLVGMEDRGVDAMPKLELIEKSIDYEHADNILNRERQRAKDYILNILSEIETNQSI